MCEQGKAIRMGIVGCGRGTSNIHLPALALVPRLRVVAVADTDPTAVSRVAHSFGIERRYTDYRQLLDHADVEAVAVVTPPGTHAEIGSAALRAGKHVFIEKPLALTREECDLLIHTAANSTGKVLVGLNFRWHRLVREARAMIRRGDLGRLKAIRSVYTHWHPGATAQPWHKSRALGGGVMLNDGVHHFDLWRFLLDTEIVQVQAHCQPSEHFKDDTCTVSARLGNGMLASAVLSFTTSPNSELEIFGEAGRLILSLYRFDGLEFYSNTAYPGSMKTRLLRIAGTIRELPQALAAVHRGGDFDATYGMMWSHFADCIIRATPPACTLDDGMKALDVAIAALESASPSRFASAPSSDL